MWKNISKYGKKLVVHGLVESHFGNISVKLCDTFIITKTGTYLDEITSENLVELYIDRITEFDKISSSETIVHREIYKNTDAKAIIHAHCPFSVIESLLEKGNSISPIDSEGTCFLHKIPIVKGKIGSNELAKSTSFSLKNSKGVIVLGHGTFTIGNTLEEAYGMTAQIEHSCKVKYYYDSSIRNRLILI
jgi:L-fuculose-phosphate aldolase